MIFEPSILIGAGANMFVIILGFAFGYGKIKKSVEYMEQKVLDTRQETAKNIRHLRHRQAILRGEDGSLPLFIWRRECEQTTNQCQNQICGDIQRLSEDFKTGDVHITQIVRANTKNIQRLMNYVRYTLASQGVSQMEIDAILEGKRNGNN